MTKAPKPGKLLNRRMMHTAARLHYVERLSQVEVSRRMEVSTATVSRLLGLARDEGIVRIQVIDLDETDGLGDKLGAALGLRSVRVIESSKAAALNAQVSALLTEEGLGQGAVVAIGWGRTIQSVISAGLPKLPAPIVVPTSGGMQETASHFQINEFVRMAAEQMGGEPRLLYAPSLVTPELREVLLRDPATARLTELWSRVDVAIVGIGPYAREAANSTDMGFAPDEAARVRGDVVRHYFDDTGAEVRWPGQENQMSISRPQLERVPLSIGVAMGREKAASVLAAARTGMVNALVIDTRAAGEMLDLLETEVTH